MKNYTRELGCFHSHLVSHGGRRKRCVLCGKTFTLRKRKRGRKARRASTIAFKRYLTGKTSSVSSRYLCRARDVFNRNAPWPDITSLLTPPYVFIADALHIRTRKYKTFVHVTLVTSPDSDRAWLLPPYFDATGENCASWEKAFADIPCNILSKTKALICDGKSGLLGAGTRRGWFIQRCQFHFISRLQIKRSKFALSRHRKEGVMLYELAKVIFSTRSEHELGRALRKLSSISKTEPNKYLRAILSGLLKNSTDYRTYLLHPKLNLPQTTNAVECVNSLIRDLMRRMRGFENEASAHDWIESLLKIRQHICLKKHRISARYPL
jgi:transposase-like protein